MTVSTVENRKTYNGNAVTTAFATPYFLADADLVVYVNGVLQTITTHYTVAGAGVPAGGTVTFVTAPGTGTSNVVILRDPALTQLLDLVENDKNPAGTREAVFDKLTMIAQRLAERNNRAFRMSDADPTSEAGWVMPLPAARASMYLAFDAAGDLVFLPGVAETPAAVTYVNDVATLRTMNPTTGRVLYAKRHTYEGGGGGGHFRAVVGAAAGTYVEDYGYAIVPTGGDGSAAWLRIPEGPVLPVEFGADWTGATDSLTAFTRMMSYVATLDAAVLDGVATVIDGDGGTYTLSDTFTITGAEGITFLNGLLVADSGSAWGAGANPVVDINSTAAGTKFRSWIVDCGKVASGVKVGAGNCRINENDVFHFVDYGIYYPSAASGDTHTSQNRITQWKNTDAEYNTQSNFTGKGLWVDNADCKFDNNTVRWCGTNVHIGANAGTLLFNEDHFYNGYLGGVSKAITGITQANPGVLTVVGHGFVVNQVVWVESVLGMTEINNLKYYVNTVVDADHITLKNGTGTPIDTTAFTAYVSGGTANSGFEDTKNIVVEAGAGSTIFNECYLDNGEIDLYNENVLFDDCRVLVAIEKATNDYVIKLFSAEVNDTPKNLRTSNWQIDSTRVRTGAVKLIEFEDYTGNWASNFTSLYSLLALQSDIDFKPEGSTLVKGKNDTDPALVLYSPSASTTGTRLWLVDNNSTVTSPPFLRSAGDGLRIRGGGTTGDIRFQTNGAVDRIIIGADGDTRILGDLLQPQAAPVAADTTSTLTAANLLNSMISTTPGGAVTLTLPSGADLDTAIPLIANHYKFPDWSVINLDAANTSTIAAGTNHTVVGAMGVGPLTSALFRTRRDSVGNYVTYRIG